MDNPSLKFDIQLELKAAIDLEKKQMYFDIGKFNKQYTPGYWVTIINKSPNYIQ